MRIKKASACLLVVLFTVGVLAAADSPFIGSWKLDQSKSALTGNAVKYESAGPGKVRESANGQSYTVTTDGKENPAPLGRISSLKQLDENTWEETTSFNGKVENISRSIVSADGKTLTEVVKGTRPDGSSYENTYVYERQGDGSGMIGTWKVTNVKLSSPGILEFADNGSDGLTFKSPTSKVVCPLKFDGKDYACTGPTVAVGVTFAMTKTGDRAIEIAQKMDGKTLFKHTYEVSNDGKTLTIIGGSPSGQPTKRVFERQ